MTPIRPHFLINPDFLTLPDLFPNYIQSIPFPPHVGTQKQGGQQIHLPCCRKLQPTLCPPPPPPPIAVKPEPSHHRQPEGERHRKRKHLTIFPERWRAIVNETNIRTVSIRPTLELFQQDQHQRCFKGNTGRTSERHGSAHMGFPWCLGTLLQ